MITKYKIPVWRKNKLKITANWNLAVINKRLGKTLYLADTNWCWEDLFEKIKFLDIKDDASWAMCYLDDLSCEEQERYKEFKFLDIEKYLEMIKEKKKRKNLKKNVSKMRTFLKKEYNFDVFNYCDVVSLSDTIITKDIKNKECSWHSKTDNKIITLNKRWQLYFNWKIYSWTYSYSDLIAVREYVQKIKSYLVCKYD